MRRAGVRSYVRPEEGEVESDGTPVVADMSYRNERVCVRLIMDNVPSTTVLPVPSHVVKYSGENLRGKVIDSCVLVAPRADCSEGGEEQAFCYVKL